MANDCLDDVGYSKAEAVRAEAVTTGANIRRVAAIAIAIDNAAQLISNYRDQRKLSDRALKISEAQQKHIQQNFWPRELDFLNEFGTPEELEAAETLGRRYAGRLVSSVAAAYTKAINDADCNASRYCTSARAKAIQDLLVSKAQAIANARVLGRNIGFAEYQARNDRNYDRRLQAVQLGRGLLRDAASLYGKAGEGLASVGRELSNRLGSAMEFFGSAERDPGAPIITPDMITSRTMDRMPYTAPSRQGGTNRSIHQFTNGIGLGNTIDGLMQSDANSASGEVNSGLVGLAQTNPSSVWRDQQHERWNEGDVGNRDLARTGSVTYPVQGGEGGRVTVHMSDFPLQYVDHKNPGDS